MYRYILYIKKITARAYAHAREDKSESTLIAILRAYKAYFAPEIRFAQAKFRKIVSKMFHA